MDFYGDLQNGIKEVVLTGVEISNYQPSLGSLADQLLKKTKIEKISFGSINIQAFDKIFLSLLSYNQSRLTSHFHIPLQSGCNTVLERMKRKYRVEKFLKKLLAIKTAVPNFSLSTDLIVGFPGETEEEFKRTVVTLKKIKKLLGANFRKIHVFRYSPRKRTVASVKENDPGWERVSDRQKKLRSEIIRQFLNP